MFGWVILRLTFQIFPLKLEASVTLDGQPVWIHLFDGIYPGLILLSAWLWYHVVMIVRLLF